MSAVQKVLYFFDWRFFAAVAAAALALALCLSIYSADTSRRRASSRITERDTQITKLTKLAQENSERIGELIAKTDSLAEQVRQLGGKPVTTSSSKSTPTPSKQASQPSSSPAPTTTTAPSTPPTTTPVSEGRVGCVHPPLLPRTCV